MLFLLLLLPRPMSSVKIRVQEVSPLQVVAVLVLTSMQWEMDHTVHPVPSPGWQQVHLQSMLKTSTAVCMIK